MTASPPSVTRVTADRRHMLRGKRNLDWFFQNRKWLRLHNRSIHAAYALRSAPEGEQPIQFLLIAAKRDMKRAHDRNKAKRWLRAAIIETPMFSELEGKLIGSQLLVMLRITTLPAETNYNEVRAAVEEAATTLSAIIARSRVQL